MAINYSVERVGPYHPRISVFASGDTKARCKGSYKEGNQVEQRVAKINRQIQWQTVERTDKCIGSV